ncbi:MAG TPA: Asp-tRNA(Asn)/Glu-tRNA(Gln) amidotransferase subunit GatA [Candidatus Saccharimonadales bacterium]|jgi:aspartyl-tRNA(Asn)/glutamyl-tRNA(Gln) amidotransferase subunit A
MSAATTASQWLPIAEIAAKVVSGELRAVDLVEQSLRTIAEHQQYNAIIATTEDRARTRARQIDADIAASKPAGRLAGVPFIAKDNYLVFGAETTAASNILRGFTAPYQSTVIERLEAEGAICVAKANMDAFAHGGSTENSDFYPTKNPHDMARVPGGSSGGSAAAVVLDMAPFALGTDTGGSIRQPASFSGCVGFKPTYGLTSRSGVVAMASSTDVMGPLTRTVADSALVFDVIAGRDQLDSTTIERDAAGYADLPGDINLTGKKIGVIREYMGDSLQPGVSQIIDDVLQRLRTAGADVQELSLPSLPLSLAVYYIIVPAEISSNLSRYDGQRFGYSYPDATTLEDSYRGSRGTGFGKEAKRRIMIGTYVLSSGYYDAYYKKAQTVRTKIINEFAIAFEQVDFLLGPVAPTTAFKIGENSNDPLQMYLSDVMTVGPSLAGIPAISVPVGMVDGLPVGVQLMAAQRADRSLLAFARQTEELVR